MWKYNSMTTKLMKLQNAKHKMDVVDINAITKTLSGCKNIINTICEWHQFVETGLTALCVFGFIFCVSQCRLWWMDFSLL